jgi:O-antigen/teichoic acid export membrane protein
MICSSLIRGLWKEVVERNRLARNAFANVLQTLASAALLLALYRYVNSTLGIEQLGVWSVVLATVSASRLADMGLSAGVVRFVARYRALGQMDRAGEVIDTTALTLMVSIGAVLPLLYPLLMALMPYLFQSKHLAQALLILPYAVGSLWLIMVGAVFQSGLDGCQRMDLRAGLVVAGQALLLALAFFWVPHSGLMGLAWAQIGQGAFLLIAGRLLLRHVLPSVPRMPHRWRWPLLREMLGYGINLQAATLFMLMLDPVTNAMMARFGGAAAAGYFTMANQVVVKTRALIVSANQVVVPHVATLAESEPGSLDRLYRDSMSMLVFLTLPLFALLFAWSGGFSWLLADSYEPEFVFLIGVTALAWSFNILAGPAYFENVGTGHVGWNTMTHLILAVLNVGLGWSLGSLFGADGVAYAYAIALTIASSALIAVFPRQSKAAWRDMFSADHLGLFIASLVVVAFGWRTPLLISNGGPSAFPTGLILPPLVLGVAIWLHPMRRRIFKSLAARSANT